MVHHVDPQSQMAKRLMAEDDDEESSSVAESAEHTNDEDSVMDDSPAQVNGIAH